MLHLQSYLTALTGMEGLGDSIRCNEHVSGQILNNSSLMFHNNNQPCQTSLHVLYVHQHLVRDMTVVS